MTDQADEEYKALLHREIETLRWAWLLKDPRRIIEPVRCGGALNVWEVPPEETGRCAWQL